ncbi:MAG TPA: kelch repeat-containing protein [Pyrinomonadaceae bacterium]|nr:kelch repeat-containing protein [Pyrinomonadaceae bacterium]
MPNQISAAVLSAVLTFATASCPAQPSSSVATRAGNIGHVSEIAKLTDARASHTSTLLNDGRVLIAGGMERNGVYFDSAEIFDPRTNRFAPEIRMTAKRVSHSATLLPDGRVLMAGGWSTPDGPAMTAEIFDPRTETFTPTGNLHRRRANHSATLLADGKVLIAGGTEGENSLKDAEVFDPKTNSFAVIGTMSAARLQHTATTLSDGRILFAGGETGRNAILASAEIFDPKTTKFTPLPNQMTAARYKHDGILLKDGRVLIWGGSNARDWQGQYKSAEIFDPRTGKFTATSEMNFARFKVDDTSVLLPDGRVLIAGGGEMAEIFDPRTNSFAKADGAFGVPLHYASVTLLADGRALIVGGYGNGSRYEGPVSTNRAWIFQL